MPVLFTPNVPQGPQKISGTQNTILNNFQAIDELVSVNHVSFNTASDFGKHKWASFPVQGAAPALIVGECGIYNKANTDSTKNELHIQKQNFAGTVDIPFTAAKMGSATPFGCKLGWSYLPSGLLIKWGSKTTPTTSTLVPVTVDCGGPNFTEVFQVLVTGRSNAINPFTACLTAAAVAPTGNFTVKTSSAGADRVVSYLVIGV